MVETLLLIVILLSFISIGLVIFVWIQFNSTESRLVKLIENRIRLHNLNYKLEKLEHLITDES